MKQRKRSKSPVEARRKVAQDRRLAHVKVENLRDRYQAAVKSATEAHKMTEDLCGADPEALWRRVNSDRPFALDLARALHVETHALQAVGKIAVEAHDSAAVATETRNVIATLQMFASIYAIWRFEASEIPCEHGTHLQT